MSERKGLSLRFVASAIRSSTEQRLVVLPDHRVKKAIEITFPECDTRRGKKKTRVGGAANNERRRAVITPDLLIMFRGDEVIKVLPLQNTISDFDDLCERFFPDQI